MKTFILFLFSAVAALAQSHTVTLTWSDTVNPTGTTYSAWRQTGACPGTAPTTTTGFTQLNSTAITAKSYADTTVTAGATYCYVVTATGTSGPASGPSNDAQAIVPGAFPPSGLTVTAN